MRRGLPGRLRMFAAPAIIAVLVWQVGTGAFVAGLRTIDAGGVLAALGIGAATTVLCAGRWCLVARRLGLRLPLGQAVRDYYRSLFLNAVLPAGLLGDVHRAVRHGRQEGDVGRGVRAVALERAAGQAAIIVAGVAVLLARPAVVPARLHDAVLAAGAVFAAAAVAVPVAAATFGRRWAEGGSRWLRGLATALDDARTGLLSRRAWPGVALLSAAALAGHLALFVVAARTAGATAPVVQLLPPMVLALLAMGLPVGVGGWGPREGVATLAFGSAGLGAAQGLSAAVVYGVLALVASLPGAAVLLAARTDLRTPLGSWRRRVGLAREG